MAENGELLKRIWEGQIKLTAKVDDLSDDMKKVRAVVIEGEGSMRPLTSRVDRLEDEAKSRRRKAGTSDLPGMYQAPPPPRAPMPSTAESTGPIEVVDSGNGRWKWVLPIVVAGIAAGGGVLAAILAP
jgi:hypothetical protein